MTNLYLKLYSDGTPGEFKYFPEEPNYADGWFRVVDVWRPGCPDPVIGRLERVEEDIKIMRQAALREEWPGNS
jgi:hypothetical protein